MEIYEKVRRYLYRNVGNMTLAGTPVFNVKDRVWKVPVLCKTERGILVVGEFILDETGNFINIPTKDEMLRAVEIQLRRIPLLFYGDKKELEKKGIEAVVV